MRLGKGIVTVLLAAAMLLLGASYALAEEEVKVEVIMVDPAEISAAEPVTITFEISNHSAYELSGITIMQGTPEQGGLSFSVPSETIIPPSGSAKIPIDVHVTDAQIGLPVKYTVSWLCAGEPFSKELEATVGRAQEPTITVSRTVSKTHARQGEELTISYTLKNDTNFDMTDIMLIDEQLSDDPICRNDTLHAKASYTFEHTYRMGTEDVISAPVTTYVVNGKTKSFAAVEPVTISMILIDVRMEVQPGTPSAVGVPFTVTATNAGNQKVSEITIKDERGVALNEVPFSLDVGAVQAVSCNIIPVMTEPLRNAAFTLSGTDAFGETYTVTTKETYPITPFVDDSQINVSFSGAITQEWTAQNGSVAVRLLINNISSVALTNASLSEALAGVLMTYPTLANGQTVFEQEIAIGSPRDLSFTIKATDPAGTERTVATYSLTVAVPEETPVPEATPETDAAGQAVGLWANPVARILIIMGAILLLAFAVMMILTLLERSRSPRGGLFLDEDDEDDDNDDFFLDEPEDIDLPQDEDVRLIGSGRQTPEAMRRAQLYVPQRRFAPEEEDAPAFDDVLPESYGYPEREADRRFNQADEFAADKDPMDPYEESANNEDVAAEAGFVPEQTPPGIYPETEPYDYDAAAFVGHELLGDRQAPRTQAPKVIAVRRAASVQPKQYTNVKRVQTTQEKPEKPNA